MWDIIDKFTAFGTTTRHPSLSGILLGRSNRGRVDESRNSKLARARLLSHTRRVKSILMRLVAMILFATWSWAQLTIEIQPTVGRTSDRIKEAQRRLVIARQKNLREASAAEEKDVINTILTVYRSY